MGRRQQPHPRRERLTLSLASAPFAPDCSASSFACCLPVPIANAFFVAFVPLSAVMLHWGALHGKQRQKRPPSKTAADHACSQRRESANKRRRLAPETPPQKTGTLARLFVAMFLMELVARSSLMLSGEFFTSVLSYPSSSFEFARLCGTFLASDAAHRRGKMLEEALAHPVLGRSGVAGVLVPLSCFSKTGASRSSRTPSHSLQAPGWKRCSGSSSATPTGVSAFPPSSCGGRAGSPFG